MHWRLKRLTRQLKARVRAWRHPRVAAWERLCGSPDRPVLARLSGGMRLRIYPGDVIGREIFLRGTSEPGEYRFVERFLRPGMVFCDVGANVGQYTVLAARRVGPAGQVHSFEPSPRAFRELKFNVALNGLDSICTLNEVALFDSAGTRPLSRYAPGCEVYASLGVHRREQRPILGFDPVTTITLDAYVALHGLRRIDLVKVDVEGAELPALRGARQLLAQPEAPTLLVELSDENAAGLGYAALDTWDFLVGMGYVVYRVDARGHLGRPVPRPARIEGTLNIVARKPGDSTRA